MPRESKELTKQQKDVIRTELDHLINRIASDLHQYPEAIATELFYRLQRHPQYGRNATTAQKNASFSHWKGICQKCLMPVKRKDAKFHHLRRGIQDQHAPINLVPYHSGCHDDEHEAVDGSLSKGSPRRKAEPAH